MLHNRAKVDQANLQGRTPLHLAVISGNLFTVKVLVEFPSALVRELKRDIVDIICNQLKLMPKDLASFLTEMAVPISNIEILDTKGRSALDIAEMKGWTEIARYLRDLMTTNQIDHMGSRIH